MYCLRWWIPLFLLPFPKTSPIFLVLFLVSFVIHTRPCVYCAFILFGLFATSPNWFPNDLDVGAGISRTGTTTVNLKGALPAAVPELSASPLADEVPSSSVPASSEGQSRVNSTAAAAWNETRPSRGWIDWGHDGGNGFWNPLHRLSSNPGNAADLLAPSPPKLQDGRQVTTVLTTLKIPPRLSRMAGKFGVTMPDEVVVPRRVYVGLGQAGGLGVFINLAPGGADPSPSQRAVAS